jgi:ParB/RepB/Spo0J family partition protein
MKLPTDLPATGQLVIVTSAQVVASLTNPRKTFAEGPLQELADSIRIHGILQPLLARPLPAARCSWPPEVQYEVVAGERRLRAAIIAMVDEIPLIVRELDDIEVRKIQLIENLQREDLNALEEAESYRAILDEHLINADQLAEQVGKSRSYIYGRLRLCVLTTKCRESLEKGELDASVALYLARIPVPSLMDKALQAVLGITGYLGRAMSAREAQKHIEQSYTRKFEDADWLLDDATLVPAAGACSTCQKRTGVNTVLFADASADVCTDPDCFTGKCAAYRERKLHDYTLAGHTIKTAEESTEFMDYPGAVRPSICSGLQAIDDATRDAIQGKDVNLVILQNAHGDIIECADAQELAAVLPQELEHNKSQLDDEKNAEWVRRNALYEQKRQQSRQQENLINTLKDLSLKQASLDVGMLSTPAPRRLAFLCAHLTSAFFYQSYDVEDLERVANSLGINLDDVEAKNYEEGTKILLPLIREKIFTLDESVLYVILFEIALKIDGNEDDAGFAHFITSAALAGIDVKAAQHTLVPVQEDLLLGELDTLLAASSPTAAAQAQEDQEKAQSEEQGTLDLPPAAAHENSGWPFPRGSDDTPSTQAAPAAQSKPKKASKAKPAPKTAEAPAEKPQAKAKTPAKATAKTAKKEAASAAKKPVTKAPAKAGTNNSGRAAAGGKKRGGAA